MTGNGEDDSEHDLALMLRNHPDESDRSKLRTAYYRFAAGDPETFPVKFAVLLSGHCTVMEGLPKELERRLAASLASFAALLSTYQAQLKTTGDGVSQLSNAFAQQMTSIESLASRMDAAASRMEAASAHADAKITEINDVSTKQLLLSWFIAAVLGAFVVLGFLFWLGVVQWR
jgi:hypothetical protein